MGRHRSNMWGEPPEFAPDEITIEGVVYRRGDLPSVIRPIPMMSLPVDDTITFNGRRYRSVDEDVVPGVSFTPLAVPIVPNTVTMNGHTYRRA